MDMSKENDGLIKKSDLTPVSFTVKKTYHIGIVMVVDLLKKALKEEAPITKDSIIECYLDFVFRNKDTVERRIYYNNNKKITREELSEKRWYLEQNSLSWFKKNLGAAIIAGKLLAIPIIEIE